MIPWWDGANRSISSHTSAIESSWRSPSRWAASSAAIIQSGHAWPGGTSFWPTRLIRPSMLVVVPGRSWSAATGSTTSASSFDASGDEAMDTTKSTLLQAPLRQSAIGEVGSRVGTQQDKSADTVFISGGPEQAGGVEATSGRQRSPRTGEPLTPGLQRGPSWKQARSQPHIEGPVDIAPPKCGKEPGRGEGGSEHLGRLGHQRSVLGQRWAADDHHHVLGSDQAPRLGQRHCVHTNGCAVRSTASVRAGRSRSRSRGGVT